MLVDGEIRKHKKYIRTKNGTIIDVTGKKIVGSYYGMKPDEICVNCEYTEAATIEELCDAFVKKSKERGNDYFNVGTDANVVFDRKYGATDLVHYHYYGAVFTERALTFVAELNDRGELELL